MNERQLWNDWYTAELYHEYVHEYPIYRRLNGHLAELAELATARRVLDLASGTGATSLACLRRLPAHGEIVGVDGSEAMVELAEVHVRDPRARFAVAAASTVSEAVSGSFDRAVCNAAFWKFPDPRSVLCHVGRLLEPGGLFVFNVPAERVVGERSEIHPFQVALMRAIESRTGQAFRLTPRRLDPDRLEEWLDRCGFDLVIRERLVCTARQGELMELMRIPAMITPLIPELSPESRQAVVSLAGESVDPRESVAVPWIYFGARRR